jgi:enterochelin esterase-like enzyme
MKRSLKKTTATLTCLSLIAGSIAVFPLSANAQPAEVDDTLYIDPSPEDIDDEPEDQPAYYNDEELIEQDAVPTNISFAQPVQEASYRYYEPAEEQGTLEYFNYTTQDYDGDNSPEDKYAVVYLPYGYDSSSQYDIFYLMHGVYGYAEIFLGYPDYPTTMKNMIDHLIEDGTIRPMIIVCMTYYDHNEQEINDNEDADITKAFSNEFINDLMPAVESSYSTYAASSSPADLAASRDHRIFGGFSMGGVTTWYAFAQSMAYCRYYFPISGMLYWGPDYPQHGKKHDKWSGKFLASSLKSEGFTKNDFYIYMATGGYDEAKVPLEDQIYSMEQQKNVFTFGAPFEAGVNCTYAYSEYEEHSWQAVFQYLYNGLPVFSAKIGERSGS